MSLVVEDGTGLSNAESFISVAAASTRHTALGNAAWAAAANDTVREQALRRATAYMEQAYRRRWLGIRAHEEQALSWPRAVDVLVDDYLLDTDIIPAEVKNACADLALRALAEDLSPDLERAVVREKVGPIETEYDRASPQSKRFRAVDAMLAPYLKANGVCAPLVRA